MSDRGSRPPSSLKISIRPLQSSFFAGEDFLCQITFTNTNPRVAHTQPLLQGEFPDRGPSFDDKAGRRVVSATPTHSKSRSVDVRALGRDDGSSSGRKKVLRDLNGDVLPERRGLIGKTAPASNSNKFIHPWNVGPPNSHRSTRSVALPSQRNTRSELGLGHPTLPATPTKPAADGNSTPNPPSRISSLPKRTPSAPISPHHSHSRKKSFAQVQAEDLTEAFELDSPLPSSSSPSPSTTRTSWLGHDPPNTSSSFYGMGRNDTMESVFRENVSDWAQKPSLPSPIYPPLDTAPGSEKVLWSFAQVGGTIEVDESLIKPGDFENLKRRLAHGDLTGQSASSNSVPGTPRTLGGGDFGQTSDTKEGQGGWGGLLRPFSSPQPPSHRRTGSTLLDSQERTLQSRSVPTFSTPPSILAVDLTLAPGESRSYEFRLRLPVDLPPSYGGKAVRLKYVLSLGVNKGEGGRGSRLIQVPIRVYNHVGVGGFRPFYDLMNPVILTKELAEVKVLGDEGGKVTPPAAKAGRKAKTGPQIGKKDLQEYTKQLLSHQPSSPGVIPEISSAPATQPNSCKSSIDTLTRTSSKVSYDISKDGKIAAVLTLTRSRFRLGETITGIININQSSSLARISRFSATLETFEEIQPSIATLPPGRLQRMTKVVHAEHHESCLDKGRARFGLEIPSGASPEFTTSGVKLNWLVRLSFLTISATKEEGQEKMLPPPHLLPAQGDGFSRYHVSVRGIDSLAGRPTTGQLAGKVLREMGRARETKLETVECAVPVSVLPNSTSYKVGDAEFYA